MTVVHRKRETWNSFPRKIYAGSSSEIATHDRHMFGFRSTAFNERRPGGHRENRASPKDADAPKETARSTTYEM